MALGDDSTRSSASSPSSLNGELAPRSWPGRSWLRGREGKRHKVDGSAFGVSEKAITVGKPWQASTHSGTAGSTASGDMEEQLEQHNGGLCRAYSAPLSVALGERDSFAPVTPPGLLQQLLQGGLELSPLASPTIATRDDAGLSADPTARALPHGGDRQAPAGPRDAPNTSRGLLSQAFARRGPVRPLLERDEDVGPSRARPWPREQEPSDGLLEPSLEDPARSSSSGSEGLLTVTVLLQTSGGAAAADVVAPETVPLAGVGRGASPSSCPAADGPDSVPTHISSLDHSAAASPLRLQPYDLGRSRLWRAAQPRGRPPLPRMRRVPRYLSIAPTVSSDLFPLSAHDPAPPAAATASTGGGASASPLRSTGGSPFGSLLPICAGAWGCSSPSASGTGTGTGGQGFNSAADADGCVCWGGSAWTQRTSPFAQLAALAEGGAEGDGDVEAGALGAALVRPSSPGPGPLVAGGSAGAGGCGCGSGGGSAGVQQQPSAPAMSDDELDDYYIQTFCGGVDPLEALMREEASRELPGGAALDVEQHASQELAASPDAVTLRDPRHDPRPAHAHAHGHGTEPLEQHAATRVPEAAAEAVAEPPPYELAVRQEAAWAAGGGAQSPQQSPSRHGAPRPEVDASAAFLEPGPEAEPAAEPPQPQLPQQEEEEEQELELFPPPQQQPSPRPHGGGGGSALLRADTAAPFSLPPVLDGATGLHGFGAAAHDDGMLFELELEPGSIAVQDERMPYGTCHERQPGPQPWRPRAVASLPPLRLASPADCTVAAAATAAAAAVIGPATPDPSAAVLSCAAAAADAADAAVPDEDCIMVEASLVVVPAAPCPAGSGHPSPVSPACPHCAGSTDATHGTLWPHASCSSHEASAPVSGSPSALAAGPCEGPQPASTECHVRLRAACCYHHAMVELHPSHKQLLLRCIEEQIGPLASPRAAAASTPASTPAAADVDAGAYRPGSPAPAPAPGGPQPGSEPGAHHGRSQAASGEERDGWGLGLGPGLDFGLGLGLGSPSASAAAGGAAAAPVVSPSACPSAFAAAAAAAELASVSTALGGPGPAPQGQLVVSLDRVESCAHCSVAREVRSMVRQAVWMNCFRTDSVELGSSPRALGSSPCGCAVRSPAAAGAVPATRQMAV